MHNMSKLRGHILPIPPQHLLWEAPGLGLDKHAEIHIKIKWTFVFFEFLVFEWLLWWDGLPGPKRVTFEEN